MAAETPRSVSLWLPPVVFIVAGLVLVLLAKSVTVPLIRPETLTGINAERAGAIGLKRHLAVASERADTPTLVLTRVERLPVGGELRERLWLLDPRPLFLPDGRGGAGGTTGPLGGRDQSPATGPISPALHFPDRAPAKDVMRPSSPDSLVVASRLAEPRWFRGMARQAAIDGVDAGAVRVARVEVYPLDGTAVVAVADIAEASGIGAGVWRPLTLTVLVGAAGAVGHPTLVTSSGVDEVDDRIRWIVGRELLPRLPLRPGVYRLEVGP